MTSAFVERRPWATVVIVFILGPAIGMFYLGKGLKGIAYLSVELLTYALAALTLHYEVAALDLEQAIAVYFFAVRLFGALHCYLVSRGLAERPPSAWFARFKGLLGICLAVLVFLPLLVRSLYLEPFNIPSGAMLPTLQVGDHLFVSKYAYGYSRFSIPFSPRVFEGRIFARQPERGDVAVFRKPNQDDIDYIKRIVGLPGDRIQMIGGRLHINGKAVPREKIGDRRYERPGGGDVSVTEYIETLPNGRQHLIYEENDRQFLDNTAAFVIPEGHVFAMGDNRDNSQDSRVLHEVGFIPVENLVGRLELIFWNSSRRKIPFLE